MTISNPPKVKPQDAASITRAGSQYNSSDASEFQILFDRVQQAPAGDKTTKAYDYAASLERLARDEGISSIDSIKAAARGALTGAGVSDSDLQWADKAVDAQADLDKLHQVSAEESEG